MDKETKEQFELLHGMMDKIMEYIDERARHTEILIENTVTKRIDSLFDGYQLTHEKQWELERRMEKLEQIVDDLKLRIAQ